MCRNFRELTDEEIVEIEQLYPVTPNREIARKYGISLDALQDNLASPRGWKKDYKVLRKGNRGGKSLTEKQVQWIIRHYKHTKNEDILKKFGVGESTLHRCARKYGLKKSRQQMRKTQMNAALHAREVCRRYGFYEELSARMKQKMNEMLERGERIPGSFMPGESNRDRLSPKRFRECMEKMAATMREIRRKERLRIHWGLPQKTRLRISWGEHSGKARKRVIHRNVFRKYKYIVGRGDNTVYYDMQTDRRPQMEANAHLYGLKVKPLET